MTQLSELIAREIAQTGPISVARYMELCLSHPKHGYYATRDPLGVAGDFTTAPEISQMFGEMLGVWAAAVWTSMGRPGFNLVELGPGRGTLMADMMRVLRKAGAAPQIWLIETSPALRAEQLVRVPDGNWADTLDAVPDGPAILIANEFLDALPVHQFLRSPEGWRERQVGLTDGDLAFGLSAPVPDREEMRDWLEVSPIADAIVRKIGERLAAHPGAALLVDYGYTSADAPPGPTLQALRRHEQVSPLHKPGDCDITWLIDFERTRDLLGRDAITDLTVQGAFLARMSIGARAEALAKAKPEAANAVAGALERLTGPDHMGTLFKVLAARSPGLPPPPGFEDPR
ncbi:MAG: SAM-dependent methyltransferase [Pseudomonadota bacterium]